jgi:hypothetical protein
MGNYSEQVTNSMNKRIRTPLEECINANDSLSSFRKQKELVGVEIRHNTPLIEVTRLFRHIQGDIKKDKNEILKRVQNDEIR